MDAATAGIRDLILGGKVDEDLDIIIDAVKDRRDIVRQTENAKKKGQFKVGDRVSISAPGFRPKYLDGAVGTIDGFTRDKKQFIVDVHGKGFRLDPWMLEKVA